MWTFFPIQTNVLEKLNQNRGVNGQYAMPPEGTHNSELINYGDFSLQSGKYYVTIPIRTPGEPVNSLSCAVTDRQDVFYCHAVGCDTYGDIDVQRMMLNAVNEMQKEMKELAIYQSNDGVIIAITKNYDMGSQALLTFVNTLMNN